MRVLGVLLCALFVFYLSFPLVARAGEICMSEDTAAAIVVELEQKRILERQVQEQELLIKNLTQQINLLKVENDLLKEQIELLKEQVSLYRVRVQDVENELSRERVLNFFGKLQMIGVGIAVGVILMLVAH